MKTVNLMEALGEGVLQDVSVEGMQDTGHNHDDHEGHEHDDHEGHDHDGHEGHDHDGHEGHDHDDHESHDHDDHEGHDHDDHEGHDHEGHDHNHENDTTSDVRVHQHGDEHIWLSLRNAQVLVNAILEALQAADPEFSALYQQNAANYIQKLKELDQLYTHALANKANKTLLFADRFPFRYLLEDYGINYYAAFAGCAAETEASFETIAFLAEKTRQLQLPALLILDGSDQKLAQAVLVAGDRAGTPIEVLNAMQSQGMEAIKEGQNYLSIMEENLKTILAALPLEQ